MFRSCFPSPSSGRPGRKSLTPPPRGGERDAPADQGAPTAPSPLDVPTASPVSDAPAASPGISPRARNVAASSGLSDIPAVGSGPGGRIIEGDVRAALQGRSVLTPAGSGIGGRVTSADLIAAGDDPGFPGPVSAIPVTGIRRRIARRMHASLSDTAQLTLNTSADATSLLQWRAGFKTSPEEMGISTISINDLIMFTLARLLPKHPSLNATFSSEKISRYKHVHLGFAVDTPRGLMVPVIPYADTLSLSALSAAARGLAADCRDGKVSPDQLSGGTFTVTNLGTFGIESFTPVLNVPEVAILGVGAVVNTPIETNKDGIGLQKRIGLSLTIDHQAVDGAPGARFLKDLTEMLAHLEWTLAFQHPD